VEAVMRITGIEQPQDTFWRLRLIEDGALQALADKQDR